MRRLTRPQCPASLDPTNSAGATERADAIAHYEGHANGGPLPASAFDRYKAYTGDDVRAALYAAFFRKCAYCESWIEQVSPTDVEHYRPKGAVRCAPSGTRRLPGYYWLAATWENLLPSCPRCNRRAKKMHADGSHRVSGKGEWFPIEQESSRAAAPGGESNEQPLLLNPFESDPAEHLVFDDDGVVHAATTASGVISPSGEQTIHLLGLNRKDLVKARVSLIAQAIQALKNLERAEARIRQYPDDPTFRDDAEREKRALKELVNPKTPYSTAVAQVLGLRGYPEE